jgi:hypothetical protein
MSEACTAGQVNRTPGLFIDYILSWGDQIEIRIEKRAFLPG